MTKYRLIALALAQACASGAALAGGLDGSYTITLTAAKPGKYVGATDCITLAKNGSVLGWKNSGTATIDGVAGQFFVVQRQLTAWFVFAGGSAVLTANLPGGPTITGTGFVEYDATGKATLTGAYTATPVSSCP